MEKLKNEEKPRRKILFVKNPFIQNYLNLHSYSIFVQLN